MDKDYLILKRASASRPSGEWADDDFEVLADGVVGRWHGKGWLLPATALLDFSVG
jgi:hypothetical protein